MNKPKTYQSFLRTSVTQQYLVLVRHIHVGNAVLKRTEGHRAIKDAVRGSLL